MNKNDYSKYAHIIDKNKEEDNNIGIKKYLINLLTRSLIVIIIFFSLAIIYKSNNIIKDNISSYFFEESISFAKIKKMYDKYLGGLLPSIKNDGSTTEVFDEKLSYSDSSIYYDGVKLSVSEGYLVPSLEEGMVIFIGEKDDYGNTVIIENLDGIHFWYGNINTTSLKLYDYVEKGSLVGEVTDSLYLVFSRDGQYLNYEEYIY